jgi:arylsulfatase A-like enzyme
MLAALLVLALAACTRIVQNEDQLGVYPDSQYDRTATSGTQTSPTGSYETTTVGGPAYDAAGRKKSHFSTTGGSSFARGEIDAKVDSGYEGYYGAAFYLPSGTIRGSSPRQNDSVEIMGWEQSDATTGQPTSQFGGLRVGQDHRMQLVRPPGVDPTDPSEGIGKQFTLREGCWNWVVVHQRLSATSEAVNEVFLNGERIVNSSKPNSSGGAYTVKFGLVNVGSAQTSPLDLYVDNAYVSSSERMPPLFSGSLCTPLPNVLVIVTDDQRIGTVEAAMPKTSTWFRDGDTSPEPDIIGGTEFSHAFATTPQCCPSRSSIFTGRYAHNHLVRDNDEAANICDDQPYTLQSNLQRSGYETAIYGKYLNAWIDLSNPANSKSCPGTGPGVPPYFDQYGIMNGGYPSTTKVVSSNPTENGTQIGDYQPRWVREKAKSFIGAQDASEDGRPWFLYLAPYAPHEQGVGSGANAWRFMTDESAYKDANFPFAASPGQYEADISDKPLWVRNWDTDAGDVSRIFEKVDPLLGVRYPGLRDQELRTLMDTDDLVDQVFQRLEQDGEADNTLAFFISDNGYMWREHGPPVPPGSLPNECRTEGSNGTLSTTPQPCGPSAKAMPYLEAIQVPMFMRWPADPRVRRGPPADTRLAANIDIAPTVMDAVGETTSDTVPMDGRSLLDTTTRSRLLTEGWAVRSPVWASLLTSFDQPAPYQYVEYYDNDERTTPNLWPAGEPDAGQPVREYYRLDTDLREFENLLHDGNPSNDPPIPSQLTSDLNCAGHGELTGRPPCP